MKPPSFPDDWGIVSARLMANTVASAVWEVVLSDGRPAVVKTLKAAGMEHAETGALFLQWRDGHDAVRLLGRDNERLLLEHAGGTTLLDHLHANGDMAAAAIAAEMLARLQTEPGGAVTNGLMSLRQHFSSLFTKAERDRRNGGNSLFVEAASMAEDLLSNQQDMRPLHGDFHHENLIRGARGWLVIDPFGLFGDACYDAANLFYNPLERNDLCTDPVRAAALAALLAQVLGRPESDYLRYGFTHACLSASWHSEDGNLAEAEQSLAVARAVRSALQ